MNELEKSRIGEIVRLHNETTVYFKMVLDTAVRIGKLLVDQKNSMRHGGFLDWVRENLPFSDRTARRYMLLYEKKEFIETDTVSNINDAYHAIKRAEMKENRILTQERGEEQEGNLRGLYPVYEWPENREKKIFFHRDEEEITCLLALGPDEEHPYLETADFIIGRELDEQLNKLQNQERGFLLVLEKYADLELSCDRARTWGNYHNPKMDIGCRNHFMQFFNGIGPAWWGSGLGHGLPKDAFKANLDLIEIDPRTDEEKRQEKFRWLKQNKECEIKRHEKEMSKFEREEKELIQSYAGGTMKPL